MALHPETVAYFSRPLHWTGFMSMGSGFSAWVVLNISVPFLGPQYSTAPLIKNPSNGPNLENYLFRTLMVPS